MKHPTITINMDAKCAECGKGGAADSGICLPCTSKAMSGRVMRSQIGKAVQQRCFQTLRERRKMSTPVRLRSRLLAAGIEMRRSQMVQPGRVMWWSGRKSLGADDLANIKGIVLYPRGADAVDVAAADYDREEGSL